MPKRDYGQYCGLVRGIELIGERWALLIIRDLLVGPRRYTDLRHGLPRIPTNILAARLKELEENGIVQRRLADKPAAGVVYELTAYGRGLEETVVALSRWGAQSLGEPRSNEIVTADSLTMALRTTFRPEAALGEAFSVEVNAGPVVVHARVNEGSLRVDHGPLKSADLRLSGPLRALMAGEISVAEALEDPMIQVSGDPQLLARFAEIFRI